jgi:hypothetical protein
VIVSSVFGGFGMVNLLDVLSTAYGGAAWALVPEMARPLFLMFRAAIGIVFDAVTGLFGLRMLDAWQQYFAMGGIVAGMRLRSTMVIYRAVRRGWLSKYYEEVLDWSIVVERDSPGRTWALFFAWRLAFAFVLWPIKLFGASCRYALGNVRKRGRGRKRNEVRNSQYLAFFGTVAWALVLILLFLLVNVTT